MDEVKIKSLKDTVDRLASSLSDKWELNTSSRDNILDACSLISRLNSEDNDIEIINYDVVLYESEQSIVISLECNSFEADSKNSCLFRLLSKAYRVGVNNTGDYTICFDMLFV